MASIMEMAAVLKMAAILNFVAANVIFSTIILGTVFVPNLVLLSQFKLKAWLIWYDLG